MRWLGMPHGFVEDDIYCGMAKWSERDEAKIKSF